MFFHQIRSLLYRNGVHVLKRQIGDRLNPIFVLCPVLLFGTHQATMCHDEFKCFNYHMIKSYKTCRL